MIASKIQVLEIQDFTACRGIYIRPRLLRVRRLSLIHLSLDDPARGKRWNVAYSCELSASREARKPCRTYREYPYKSAHSTARRDKDSGTQKTLRNQWSACLLGMDDFRDLISNISREILVDSQRLGDAAKIKSPSGSALLPLYLSQPNRREYYDWDLSASILDTGLLTELACGTDFGDPVPTRFIISVCRASINLVSSVSKRMANL